MKKQPEDRLAQLLAVLEARTKLLAFFFGLCFVTVLLVLAIWFPNPTPFQYTVFRITLALAAAGVAGVIPGMIRLKVQPGTALLIHAGGALAVFVIVYLLAPAPLLREVPAGNTNSYNQTEEQYEKKLKERIREVLKEMQQPDVLSDKQQLFELDQKYKALQAKLSDIQKSYEEALKARKSAEEALIKLKGQLPDEQIKQAQVSLEEGNTDEAEKAFDAVADNMGTVAAFALYQSGRLAEDRLDYTKAMRQYEKALVFEEEKPEYLLAAGNMARMLARYNQSEKWLEQLLKIRKAEGKRNVALASAQNSLAELYRFQGNYREAESLFKEAFQIRKELLGIEHPDTLISINNLAELFQAAGRYGEAEPLFKQALQLREKVLGREHPATLTSLNNLAGLYEAQGRYSEAEPLFKQAFQLQEKILGREHPATLTSLNNLAGLYEAQGRYSEAEPLFKEALRLQEKVLGKEHPDTLTSLNNLAGLYEAQGRYSEAEPLFKQALRLQEKILGEKHPDTLTSINHLAGLYEAQGRYSKAEPLFKEALRLQRKILGREHPATLTSLNNLAVLYEDQSRYDEAEPLLKQVFQLREKVLGKEHPDTIITQGKYIALLINTNRPAVALHLLQDQEDCLLARSFQELYTSSSEKVRRLYLQSISNFQDAVLSLANQQQGKAYHQYAAEVMLRWKQVYAEESSFQYRLFNLSNDPETEKLQKQLTSAQVKVSQALLQPNEKQNIAELIEKANQDETALLALTRHLRTGLEIEKVTLDTMLAALPQNSGLIEYRRFFPFDFKTGDTGESHLAALLLLADPKAKQRFLFRDLGPFEEIEEHLHDETTAAYNRLLGPFDKQIKNLKQLYIAPDGPLSFLSFASLCLPDGRFLAEQQQINRLQTGRDLLKNGKDFPRGKGLVAIGGVRYSLAASSNDAQGFCYLPESRKEAQAIGQIFTNNTGEKPTVLIGDEASEYNLKHLKQPPRILHISTAGFFLAKEEKSKLADEVPLLLSGLALAGANNGLHGKLDKHGDDGLLYSLEVLGLNLHGTELVSLSACDTGKGVVDYSEGVYGLVRAFRTAGAANVLMTLTPVGDKSSHDFMTTFYDNWLYPSDPEKNWFDGARKKTRTPAEALHQTRLDFIHDKRPVQDWAPFVLVGK